MWRYIENVVYICLIANLAELKVWIHTFTMSPQRHSGLLLKMLFIGFNMWTMMDSIWNLSAACLAIVKNWIVMCFLCDFWPKPNHYVLFIWFLFQEQLKTESLCAFNVIFGSRTIKRRFFLSNVGGTTLPWWMDFPLTVSQLLTYLKVIFFPSNNQNTYAHSIVWLFYCAVLAKAIIFQLAPSIDILCNFFFLMPYHSPSSSSIVYSVQIWSHSDQWFLFLQHFERVIITLIIITL